MRMAHRLAFLLVATLAAVVWSFAIGAVLR
jgi:hypothetical protein